MTNPYPPQPGQEPQQPQPQPSAYQPPQQPGYGPQAGTTQSGYQQPFAPQPPAPKKKRTGLMILGGVGALVLVLAIIGAFAKPSASTPAAPVPNASIPADEPSQTPSTDAAEEPSEEPSEEPTEEPTAPPVDSSMKYGQTLEFTVEDQFVTLRLDAPKTAANMFDKDNIEVFTKFCNKGTDPIEDISAESLGIYAEDGSGGTYDIYGAYRKPEFPGYSFDGKKVKAGKCITGWISYDGANNRKGLHLAIDIEDTQFTWSKSGK